MNILALYLVKSYINHKESDIYFKLQPQPTTRGDLVSAFSEQNIISSSLSALNT